MTIDDKVLRAIDRAVTREKSRSRIIEDAARDYLTQRARLARDSRDREIIDRAADGLNAEMEDVLSYQVEP